MQSQDGLLVLYKLELKLFFITHGKSKRYMTKYYISTHLYGLVTIVRDSDRGRFLGLLARLVTGGKKLLIFIHLVNNLKEIGELFLTIFKTALSAFKLVVSDTNSKKQGRQKIFTYFYDKI